MHEREEQDPDHERHEEDRDAPVADHAVGPLEEPQEGPGQDAVPAEIDRFLDVWKKLVERLSIKEKRGLAA